MFIVLRGTTFICNLIIYTGFSLKKTRHVLHFTEKTNTRSFQWNRTYQNFAPSNSEEKTAEHDNTTNFPRNYKASKVSNLRCGWTCQAISDTLVILYDPRFERIRCMKSRQSFSRLTRFTREDHAYGASHLSKKSENDCFAVCVKLSEQQNPPLNPLNSALIHVTTEQVHAKKASIKATTLFDISLLTKHEKSASKIE